MAFATPAVLAEKVSSLLLDKRSSAPDICAVTRLFEVMYCCSISREESEVISFHVVYIDPDNPDPNPPPERLPDNWHLYKLESPVAVNLPNIRKLAPATDPRSSALAVYHDENGQPMVYGFVDQLNSYEDFINLETGSGQRRPGLFEARIIGPGHIAVSIDYERIAELKVSEITDSKIDVLESGPIHQILYPGVEQVVKELQSKHGAVGERTCDLVELYWFSCLKRILIRMQNLRHGGALLIVPDDSAEGLNIKFGFKYDRLHSAILTYCSHLHEYTDFHKRMDSDNEFDIDKSAMRKWYIEQLYWKKPHSKQELKATIWLISLLTRIDGLVLLSPQLDVLGFGCEIKVSEEPNIIKKALTSKAEPSSRVDISYQHYGTRHRSMMRYCNKFPGSIGLVVSQDGDVRAMTKIDSDVCIWENVRLQLEIESD